MAEFSAQRQIVVIEFRQCYTGAFSFTPCDIHFIIFKRQFHSETCVEVGKIGYFSL